MPQNSRKKYCNRKIMNLHSSSIILLCKSSSSGYAFRMLHIVVIDITVVDFKLIFVDIE